MVNTKKFSEFANADLSDSSNELVGIGSGQNIKSPKVVLWTTATRPSSPFDGLLGFNTDLEQYEFWSSSLNDWVQLASSVNLLGHFVTTVVDAFLPNSFALSTLTTGALKNTTGTGIPTISAPLTSIDGLVTSANQMIYTTGSNTYATTSLTPFSRGLFSNADALSWRTALGVPGLPVQVSEGGTGATSFTAYSVICGGTTSTTPLQNVSGVGSTGQVLTSNGAGFLPTWQNSAGTGTVNSGLQNELAYYAANGTAVSGLTTANSAVLVTSNAGAPAWTASLTNGQIIIGSTGATPTPATLTAGTGISISNSAGSITISGTGSGYSWTEVTGTSQSMAVNNGYVANNAGLVTLTLPATAVIGDTVIIQGKGTGLYFIAQNGGQTIHSSGGNTTTGVGGSLTATNRYDSIELVCITANTDWAVLTGTMGTFTIV